VQNAPADPEQGQKFHRNRISDIPSSHRFFRPQRQAIATTGRNRANLGQLGSITGWRYLVAHSYI
jgi:hypothetical protein